MAPNKTSSFSMPNNRNMKDFLKEHTIRKHWWLNLINERRTSYLNESGWIRSFQEKEPVDKKGNPIPWLSLPLIDFISPRLKSSFSMFEYGCGNSTLFFADRLKLIHSIEHHKGWYDKINSTLPSNAFLHFYNLEEGYSEAILDFENSFDIVLIDGRKRVECCKNSIEKLSPSGVLIFDDIQRERYSPIFEELGKLEFKELPFWGMNPGSGRKKCSSVFYRTVNCLGI